MSNLRWLNDGNDPDDVKWGGSDVDRVDWIDDSAVTHVVWNRQVAVIRTVTVGFYQKGVGGGSSTQEWNGYAAGVGIAGADVGSIDNSALDGETINRISTFKAANNAYSFALIITGDWLGRIVSVTPEGQSAFLIADATELYDGTITVLAWDSPTAHFPSWTNGSGRTVAITYIPS